MSKKMLINATLPEENRVAIVEDGILTELDIEVAGHEQAKGNIYKAVVVRVEPGLQAAFVDYGAERMGFLQIDEINFKHITPPSIPEGGRSKVRINDLLSRGQELLVQVIKEERGTKGAALTTFLSLAGRYMVLMPDSNTRGVSRKAENEAQRKQLKQAMTSLELPEKFGYIVRTAALDQPFEELQRDYRYLMRLYESICALDEKSRAPALIYKETNLVIRSIRDYFTTDIDEVLIDDPDVFQEAKDFFQVVMPDYAGLVKLHQERRPIFSRYQIEEQIETINSDKVVMPSGGSIVIDPTEALVAIDVNSGKMASEQGVEATAVKTNLEAAREIARQLRLRDLGGLVVIDFIDMRERKNNRLVEDQLRTSMKNDKARVTIGRISQFGLLELSRQRIRGALAEGAYRTCPHCHGAGRVRSPETLAAALLRRVHTGIAKGQIGQVQAKLPLEVASYLLNSKRDELLSLERRYNVIITIHGQTNFLMDQVEIDFQKREKEPNSTTDFVGAGLIKSLVEEQPMDKEKPATEPAPIESPQDKTDAPKKRRRRRHKKPAKEESKTHEQAAAEDHPLPDAEVSPAAQHEAPSSDAQQDPGPDPSRDGTSEAQPKTAAKPKRVRRAARPKTKKPAEEKKEAVSATEEGPQKDPQPADSPLPVPVEPIAADPETKPKRRRASRSKTKEPLRQPKEGEDPQASSQTEEAAPEKAATPPSKKPRRPTRKKTAKPKAAGPQHALPPENPPASLPEAETGRAKPQNRSSAADKVED